MLHTLGVCATMSNFMVSGILDKYEDLKIRLIESGIGWVPFVLETIQQKFRRRWPTPPERQDLW